MALFNYPASVGAPSDSVSTPGSTHNDLMSPSTFEDKRRENFNKGQAELEKRRQSLIDQQKREEEEKKKKEQEEAEEKEKQKYVHILHDIRSNWQPVHYDYPLRQELERKRLQEWEKQRKDELATHREREQEKLFATKARQENLQSELEKLVSCEAFIVTE